MINLCGPKSRLVLQAAAEDDECVGDFSAGAFGEECDGVELCGERVTSGHG